MQPILFEIFFDTRLSEINREDNRIVSRANCRVGKIGESRWQFDIDFRCDYKRSRVKDSGLADTI